MSASSWLLDLRRVLILAQPDADLDPLDRYKKSFCVARLNATALQVSVFRGIGHVVHSAPFLSRRGLVLEKHSGH